MNNGTFKWEDCITAFGPKLVEGLAKNRGYSREFCQWLRDEKLIGLYDGKHVAFPVSNGTGEVTGAHYKVKENNTWYYTKGQQALPFVIGSAEPDINHVFESQWDGLAYMEASGDRSGILITRGASNTVRLSKLLPQGSTVYLWPQNDEAGQKWAADIRQQFKGKIKVAATPAEHKDLNDWRKAGATPEDVFAAVANAQSASVTVAESHKTKQLTVGFMSDVKIEPVLFIDKPLFQKNAFHLVSGRKNTGKGTFLIGVAARVTRGELGPKTNVFWVSYEDNREMDIAPRLLAAKGDPAKMAYPRETIKLPTDYAPLKAAIESVGNVGMVVIDPLQGAMQEGKNSNADTDVRNAISPLNDLAGDLECLVVGVRHLSKGESNGPLDRVLGSTDWTNVPRVVLQLAVDDEERDIRHVQVIAGNRIPSGTASRSFRIVGTAQSAGNGKPKHIVVDQAEIEVPLPDDVKPDGVTKGFGKGQTKYRQSTVRTLLDAIAVGMTQNQALKLCGISHTTFDEWRRDHPKLVRSIDLAREKYRLGMLKIIHDAATGQRPDWRAAWEALRAAFPDDYRKQPNQGNTTNINGQQIAVVTLSPERQAELRAQRARIMASVKDTAPMERPRVRETGLLAQGEELPVQIAEVVEHQPPTQEQAQPSQTQAQAQQEAERSELARQAWTNYTPNKEQGQDKDSDIF